MAAKKYDIELYMMHSGQFQGGKRGSWKYANNATFRTQFWSNMTWGGKNKLGEHIWAIYRPFMGHLWPFWAILGIFGHLEDRTHDVGLKWQDQSMVGWSRMPYNIFWPSMVIQAGYSNKLWAISEPKMAIFTIY